MSGVCLLVCRMPLLLGQVFLSACVSTAVALCVHVCVCVVYQLVGLSVARMAMQYVDYFLPYIAMTDHVVSPVVVSGQQWSSLLAPLPL